MAVISPLTTGLQLSQPRAHSMAHLNPRGNHVLESVLNNWEVSE